MNLKPIASNMTEVEIGNKTVLFSYKTPVALISRHEDGMFVGYATETKWSRTTSKHINKFFNLHSMGNSVALRPQTYFDTLLSEVK